MSGSENTSRAGRFTALAALAASAALFVTALLGIAAIDPGADTAAPGAGPASTRSISLEADRDGRGDRQDCPWRDKRHGVRS